MKAGTDTQAPTLASANCVHNRTPSRYIRDPNITLPEGTSGRLKCLPELFFNNVGACSRPFPGPPHL